MRVTFLGSGDFFGSGGRFQTCILADTGDARILLDCGASSLIAMRRAGVEPDSIDAIVLTHFHGDHCAGVPFYVFDAMFVSRRRRPLTIAGPVDLEQRLQRVWDVILPGSSHLTPRFPLEYLELAPGCEHTVAGASVKVLPAAHTPETSPQMVRLAARGRVLAFSGDTGWTEDLVQLADGADALIVECSEYERRIPGHLSYVELAPQFPRLRARRIVLTHMGADMLAQAERVPETCARDGLTLDLDAPV
ncbi:MAG TPA: MBL fold metallo-hydrolase [Pelomicrobium sp.]|nr:MBL fold metallo-hydrolase [Pelomicrobium sp.]